MTGKDKINELLEASTNGTITAEQVTAAGLHRGILRELVENGELYRFGRGLYVRTDAWEDDFYLLQRKYGRGIYPHDTALYLLGYQRDFDYAKAISFDDVCDTVRCVMDSIMEP